MYRTIHSIATVSADKYMLQYRDAGKFIEFCKVCDKYQSCWVCPPYDFDMDSYLSGFKTVYVIGTKIIPDDKVRNDCDDNERVKIMGKQMLADVREVLDPALLKIEKNYPGSKAFFAGTCFRCSNGTCTRKKGLPCMRPQEVRPSLEAFGFDIGKTASDLLHIDLKWSNDSRFPEYFMLVSGIFTNHQLDIRL